MHGLVASIVFSVAISQNSDPMGLDATRYQHVLYVFGPSFRKILIIRLRAHAVRGAFHKDRGLRVLDHDHFFLSAI